MRNKNENYICKTTGKRFYFKYVTAKSYQLGQRYISTMTSLFKTIKTFFLSLEEKILPEQSIIKDIEDANNLPFYSLKGFVAELRVGREYKASRAIENRFINRWKGKTKLPNLEEALETTDKLCALFNVRPIKEIKYEKEKVYHSYHSYGGGTIKMLKDKIELDDLIHELAHHFHRASPNYSEVSHGKDFCDIEKEMFDKLLELQKRDKSLRRNRFSALDLLMKE